MMGTMQDWPLLVWKLIDHAKRNHPRRAVISNTVEGGVLESNWGEIHDRSKQVAQALSAMGIRIGDRVGTLAWNTHRHVELWYGICGMGAVAHTLNPRLFPEQLIYIANHASDRVLCFDLSFIKLVEGIAPYLKTVETYVCMTDRAHLPESSLALVAYEDWIGEQDGQFEWVHVDEHAPAGLCYTSGTTGDPKGVEYTHRSNLLHTFAVMSGDRADGGHLAVTMPIVPMFHANAWGVPYATAALGQSLVLNGPAFDPATLTGLIHKYGVTTTAGVPTVWLGLLKYLDATGGNLGPLKKLLIGGAAAPPSMIAAFEDRYGVEVVHSWGMTEMSPFGTMGMLTAEARRLPKDKRRVLQAKQGRAPFGVELKIVGEDGEEVPRDGYAFGRLLVRGPWIVARYFRHEEPAVDAQGWFDTGDVATIDAMGFMQIVDRSKDVIKSGGEWISSIEIENIAVGCPGVAEAAVIGVRHPKWDERPLLVVVRQPDASVTREDMLSYLTGKIARWWMPDDVVFVDAIPHTAAGKIQKVALRQEFSHYRLPTAA